MNRAAFAGVLLACIAGFAFPTACVIDSGEGDGGDNGRDAGRDAGPDASVPDDDGGMLTITTVGPYNVAYGESVLIVLAASGGTAPYQWTAVSRVGLEWAQLTTWGEITGIPPEPEAPGTVRVRVEEAGGRAAEADVVIAVGPCTDGQTRTCALSSQADGCHVGEQACVNGAWDTDGGCVGDGSQLSDDPSMCGRDCTFCDETALRCVRGNCACTDSDAGVPCSDGQTCCPGSTREERCADLSNDVDDCGTCDVRCPRPDNAVAFCTNGLCGSTCIAPYERCGRDGGNCDIDTLTSSEHCGTCGNACELGADAPNNQHQTGRCVAGTCELACDQDFADCDGDGANGCEVNLMVSSDHCSACGAACMLPEGSEVGSVWCAAGTCAYSCEPGRQCGNRCVADDNKDHCGGCDRVCSADTLLNVATAQCNATPTGTFEATCTITCDPGFADCDGDWLNGCEVDTRIDELNCGSCGEKCQELQACVNGACCQQCGAVDCCYSCDFLNDICRD